MKLQLKRPLAFFDLETTGINIGADRIVEISVIKLNPDGSEDVLTLRVHPGIPIPLESSLVHGIYDEHIKDEKQFHEIGQQIAEFIHDSDLAGYNSNKFDIPMLMEEFLRAGIQFDLDNRHFVDVQNIFHQMEQRTLRAAYQFYCDKQIINAHSAEADTRATMEVLLAQIERYENQEWEDKKGVKSTPVVGDVEALHKFTNLSRPVDFAGRMVYNEQGEETINFGKHKGKRVEDVLSAEPSYYSWMMQGDFPLYTKRKLEEIYKRWNAKRVAERQQNKPAQPAAALTPAQPQAPKPAFQNNSPKSSPQLNSQPVKRKEEPAKPVDEDMLAQLAMKFKKS
ncbi:MULTISPECIES: exonuclease domain-containing protein [unclassified Mucilaginibacter]|uniref:exonuclease domain-containing protein n=1 Tax=unclassified Mucilaginibacter TaxID=2617802 RepID=UPI002AC9A667|nr:MULTISPECIES: exonuclease domain-containing protein [unclassified Mucilaginibacter]MEB0249803.1 exonuclease domain-containing protein [Mucilaginibacter sp. 5B2]MEB0262994.1 exonuclease domain-containing protein [Mucilaginibacter sp. 10I4]MEB0280298.1 exonuclease domain-containing protein [Mucilaginibacter sp. 10B2]MEB0300243.1 exonuclease domain-containing protein [Mucilaginibacter sp. 5C4]WPX25600.1 exonuclease domain-containing protein [Mucilaginibacter sp. 5C4]